jgi:hypothetical protein
MKLSTGNVGIGTTTPSYGLDVAKDAHLRFKTYIPHTGVTGHGAPGTISELRWGSYGRLQHTSFGNTALMTFNAQLFESDFIGSGTSTGNFNRIRPDFNQGAYAIISPANGGVAFNTGMWNEASSIDVSFISNHSSYAGGWLPSGQLEVMKGVKFPATQSASSDANTLDDYEEGTWTPTLTGSGSNPTVSFTYNEGRYTKIGDTVYVEARFFLSAASGGSGDFRLSGIPFAVGQFTGGYLNRCFPTKYDAFSNVTGGSGFGIKTDDANFLTFTDLAGRYVQATDLTASSYLTVWGSFKTTN